MKNVEKKYSKHAKEFKQKIDLLAKDFEQYAKLKNNVSVFEIKMSAVENKLEGSLSER